MPDVDRTLSDTPVPAVPAGSGPRMLVLVLTCLAALGLVSLGTVLVAAPAPLAKAAGLADTSTAQVTDRTFRSHAGYHPRVRGCTSYYDYDVALGGREGHFSVCVQGGGPLVDLDVGDEVQVSSVPWSSQVLPEGDRQGTSFWALAALVAGVLVPVWAVVTLLRYRRLSRGTARGTLMTGTLEKQSRNVISVLVDDRRLVLLPAKNVLRLAPGDPVELWATRRSLFRKRLRGPWVVRASGQLGVFTHAWWRMPR